MGGYHARVNILYPMVQYTLVFVGPKIPGVYTSCSLLHASVFCNSQTGYCTFAIPSLGPETPVDH